LRDLAKVSVLRAKLQQEIVSEVPTEEEQVHFRYTSATDAEEAALKIEQYQAGVRIEVHARHILVETREEAQAVLDRLDAGEDFAALAAELSTDTSNKDDGGDLGWFPRGTMVDEFEQVAFESPLGLYPEPVETQFGYHVIDILDREERPIDLEQELFDVGWYGKASMAEQFGALFAEMVFTADIGLFPEPVPTTYGPAVIQVLERETRTLDETEREQRRQQEFQQWLDDVRTEGDIQNEWDRSMIPTRL
jgi:parvulin-like peptidyl-prolyl isomerase